MLVFVLGGGSSFTCLLALFVCTVHFDVPSSSAFNLIAPFTFQRKKISSCIRVSKKIKFFLLISDDN